MQSKLTLLIGLLIIASLAFPLTSICQNHNKTEASEQSAIIRVKVLQNQYGEGRMVLKDRSIYKKIKIHQIHDLWIVYIKNGSTHDMMKDQIDRIEYGTKKQAALKFDENGKIKIHFKR